jgi:hypothetical protein
MQKKDYSYAAFREELRQNLPPRTRESIIFLLNAPPVDLDDLVANAKNMVAFMHEEKLIQPDNVDKLLECLEQSTNPALASVISITQKYRNAILERLNVPNEEVTDAKKEESSKMEGVEH